MARAKKDVEPGWHPNFRNSEALPDIKVIRTDFLVNGLAVAISVGLLFIVAHNEFDGRSLSREITDLNSKISAKAALNENNLKLSAEFDTLSNQYTELNNFLSVPVAPSRLMMAISETLPREILLQTINYTDQPVVVESKNVMSKAINFRGSVSGSLEHPATQIVTDYIKTIEKLEILKDRLNKIELVSLVRNPQLGLFNCVIRIELKPV